MTAAKPVEQVDNTVRRLTEENLIGVSAAARKLGSYRRDKGTHPTTVVRWINNGVVLPDGSVLRLEAIRIAGRLATTWPAVLRFLSKQQVGVSDAPPPLIAPAELARRSRTAEKTLVRAGVKVRR